MKRNGVSPSAAAAPSCQRAGRLNIRFSLPLVPRKRLPDTVAGQSGVPDHACGRQRVGREHDLIKCQPLRLAATRILERPALRVHRLDRGVQMDLHAELGVDLRQFLGDAPDAVAHEAVVAVEHRAGIHHRQREGGVRIAQRHRPAFGDRHRHVDLGAVGAEVVIEQIHRAAGDPQSRQCLAQPLPGRFEPRRRGAAVALLQVSDHARFVTAEAGHVALLAPALLQLPIQRRRVAMDPGAGARGRENKCAWRRWARRSAAGRPVRSRGK